MEEYKEVTITLKLKAPCTKDLLEKPLQTAVEWFNRYNYEYVEDYSIDYK